MGSSTHAKPNRTLSRNRSVASCSISAAGRFELNAIDYLLKPFDRERFHAAVERASKVYSLYGAASSLGLHEPWDYNRLPDKTQDWIIEWMSQNLARR